MSTVDTPAFAELTRPSRFGARRDLAGVLAVSSGTRSAISCWRWGSASPAALLRVRWRRFRSGRISAGTCARAKRRSRSVSRSRSSGQAEGVETTDEPDVIVRFTYRPKWFVLVQTDGAELPPVPMPAWDRAPHSWRHHVRPSSERTVVLMCARSASGRRGHVRKLAAVGRFACRVNVQRVHVLALARNDPEAPCREDPDLDRHNVDL